MTRWTLLMALGCAVAAIFLSGFAPPKPKLRTAGVTAVLVDSTVEMTVTVSLTGQLRPGDLLRYNFWKDGSLVANRDESSLTVRQTFPAPACGTASDYWVAVRLLLNGTLQSSVKSNVVTIAAPACPEPPAPVIDSVRITPASASVSPGGSGLFTVELL